MRGSVSKIKAAHSPRGCTDWCGCPTLSHMSGASGTAKRRVDWAFVSGVSPVSPNLKLIDRTQNGIGRGGISRRRARCAETGETSAKVTRFSGETTGLRHTWDRWDTPDAWVQVTRYLNLMTGPGFAIAGLSLHKIRQLADRTRAITSGLLCRCKGIRGFPSDPAPLLSAGNCCTSTHSNYENRELEVVIMCRALLLEMELIRPNLAETDRLRKPHDRVAVRHFGRDKSFK